MSIKMMPPFFTGSPGFEDDIKAMLPGLYQRPGKGQEISHISVGDNTQPK